MILIGADADFLGFAGSHEVFGVRPGARGKHQTDAQRARRCGQRREFSRVVGIHRVADTHAYQDSALTTLRAFKQLQKTTRSLVTVTKSHRPRRPDQRHSTIAGSVTSPSSPVGNRTLRAGTTVEMACLYTI